MFWNKKKEQKEKQPLILCKGCGGLLNIEKYEKTFISVSRCIRCKYSAYDDGYNEAKINYQEGWEELEQEKECINKAWEKLAKKIKE